jgi:YHS domain-containing protein
MGALTEGVGGHGYAINPVRAVRARSADAPATVIHNDVTLYFYSGRCAERFRGDPVRFAHATTLAGSMVMAHEESSSAIEPVCAVTVEPKSAAATRTHGGVDV